MYAIIIKIISVAVKKGVIISDLAIYSQTGPVAVHWSLGPIKSLVLIIM